MTTGAFDIAFDVAFDVEEEGQFNSDFNTDFQVYATTDPPDPPNPNHQGVEWRLWVHAYGQDINVTGKTRFDFVAEAGRDDPNEQPSPGRADFTVDLVGTDRGIWAAPGVAIWLEAASGQGEARAWRRVWTGTITEVRRQFGYAGDQPANIVSVSCAGPLAVLQRLKVPAGMAGAYPQQLDGERVWRVLNDLGVSMATVRPAIGHLVNDELPEHATRWDQSTDTVTAPTWAVFNRVAGLPDVVSDEQQDVIGLHNYQTQTAGVWIGERVPLRSHVPHMADPLTDWDTVTPAKEGRPLLFTAAGTRADQALYASGPMSPTGILAGSDAMVPPLEPGCAAVPDIDIYKAWCVAVKARAGDDIAYWEPWNEPDSNGFFRGTPHELASLTWAAWEVWGNKLVGPGWTAGVLTPGRLSGWYVGSTRQTSVLFINTYFDLIKAGAATRGIPVPFKAICYHGYGTGVDAAAAGNARVALWEGFKQFIASKGLANIPLWDSEWNLRGATNSGGFPDNAATVAAFKKSIRDIESMGVSRQFMYAWTDVNEPDMDWIKDQIQINRETPNLRAAFRELAREHLPIPSSRRIEVVIGISVDTAALLSIHVAGETVRQLWLTAGANQAVSAAVELGADTYAAEMQLVAIGLDPSRTTARWHDLDDTTTWADITATHTWTPAAVPGTPMTVTLHTVDVWRSGWDQGGAWLIARDPTEDADQTAADHIGEVGTAARGGLWEQRGGGLQYASMLSRIADPNPSLDLAARYIVSHTESTTSLSSLVNEITVNYGYAGVDSDGNEMARPSVVLRDVGSMGLFGGKFAVTIDGPLLGKPAATAVARQVLNASSRPRERLAQMELVPFRDMDDLTIYQLLTLNPNAVVEVESTPAGWVPSFFGVWRGFVDGWTLTGSTGFTATMTLNVSEYFENAPPLV